jgi:hypothetical protein
MAFDIENFPTSTTAKRMVSRVSPIYGESYVAKWLYQVMGLELDEAWALVRSFRAQPFADQATWGLMYWEQGLGIDTDESKTYELRRRRIAEEIYSKKVPMNPYRLEQVVKAVCGFEAHVTENVRTYTFNVEVDAGDGALDWNAIFTKINAVKPSHMTVAIIAVITDDAEIQVSSSLSAWAYGVRICGTYPDIATVGDSTCNAEVDASSELLAASYNSPYCGDDIICGTLPQTGTVGRSETATEINASGELTAAAYTSKFSGEEDALCGTTPETATSGQSISAEAQVADTITAYVVTPTYCGSKYCGE